MDELVPLIILFWGALIFYVALTHAKAIKDRGQKLGWFWGPALYPVLFVFLIMDFILNWTLFTLILLEFPQELLVTPRIQRHVDSGRGWRYKFSAWFGRELNRFDDHIKGI